MSLRAAVFIDKDGTLIVDEPYNTNPRRVRFTPYALRGLQRLAHCGFALFVVTNQPGLGSGRVSRAAFDALRAHMHGIDLTRSWMVGDILDDIEAGRRAGCRTVLLDVGNETVWHRTPQREPHHRCADLHAAALLITAAVHAKALAA